MSIQEFFDKYNGKLVDFDGFYGGQCMDVYQQYNKEVVGGPHIPANAYEVWDRYPTDFYHRIDNAPEGVPQKGDVVIWNRNTGGGYGHIAVFSEGDANSFISFDQNWPVGSVCHLQSHNYNNVIGWLTPKNLPQPLPIFSDQTKISAALLNWPEDLEIQQLRSILKEYKTIKVDLENSRKENEQLKADNANLTSANNQQADMIADLEKQLKECHSTLPSASISSNNLTVGQLIILLLKKLKLSG